MPLVITSRKFIWGWLRLVLGFAQMSLAAAGLGAMMVIGVHPLTIALVLGATASTVASRLLYRGKPTDDQEPTAKSD